MKYVLMFLLVFSLAGCSGEDPKNDIKQRMSNTIDRLALTSFSFGWTCADADYSKEECTERYLNIIKD